MAPYKLNHRKLYTTDSFVIIIRVIQMHSSHAVFLQLHIHIPELLKWCSGLRYTLENYSLCFPFHVTPVLYIQAMISVIFQAFNMLGHGK